MRDKSLSNSLRFLTPYGQPHPPSGPAQRVWHVTRPWAWSGKPLCHEGDILILGGIPSYLWELLFDGRTAQAFGWASLKIAPEEQKTLWQVLENIFPPGGPPPGATARRRYGNFSGDYRRG